jgi:SRSO17 transposase
LTIAWHEHAGTVLRKQFAAVRVHWATGGAQLSTSHHQGTTGPEGWLLGEREVKWYFRNLPADTRLQRLVELAHSRWPTEQFYEDAKGKCGLDHYQGRRWDGLHRHLALVMPAYSFVTRQRWPPADTASFFPLGSAHHSLQSTARYSYGSSRMSCYGSWRRTGLPTSAPGRTNEVALIP